MPDLTRSNYLRFCTKVPSPSFPGDYLADDLQVKLPPSKNSFYGILQYFARAQM
jgi:hypothetical protein